MLAIVIVFAVGIAFGSRRYPAWSPLIPAAIATAIALAIGIGQVSSTRAALGLPAAGISFAGIATTFAIYVVVVFGGYGIGRLIALRRASVDQSPTTPTD